MTVLMLFLAIAALVSVAISVYGANAYALAFAVVFGALSYLASVQVFG